jgi:hypothetical protein
MFKETYSKEGGPAARTLPPTQENRSLGIELREHLCRLRVILPVISVTIMALRHQNAELDYEIASVLSYQVCQPLDEEIEELSVVVSGLVASCREEDVAA